MLPVPRNREHFLQIQKDHPGGWVVFLSGASEGGWYRLEEAIMPGRDLSPTATLYQRRQYSTIFRK